jgi:hypothetical protein
MAISSLMSSKAVTSSTDDWAWRCKGELKPMPAGRARRRAAGRRSRLDWARLRRRDFENSLTAYSWPYWSTARWTAPKEPRPISCLMRYWLMRCWAVPSSSELLYSERALSVSLTRRVDEAARRWCRRGLWYAGVDLGQQSAPRRGTMTCGEGAHGLDGQRAAVGGEGGHVERGPRAVDAGGVGGGRLGLRHVCWETAAAGEVRRRGAARRAPAAGGWRRAAVERGQTMASQYARAGTAR